MISKRTSFLNFKFIHIRSNYFSFFYRNNLRLINNKNSQYKNIIVYSKALFNETNNKEDQRYYWNYETPENQDVSITSLKLKMIKFTSIFIAYLLVSYFLFFRKYNPISKDFEVYFINDKLEIKLADFISNKLKNYYTHYIYKQDSSEVRFILKIYKNLISQNKIAVNEINEKNIFIIDSPIIGGILLKNGDLFISNRIIELSNYNENKCALFIATYISSVLMGKCTKTIFKYILNEYKLPINKENLNVINPNTNYKLYKFSRDHYLSKYVYFYPETVVSNYHEEVKVLEYALKLMDKAGYDLQEV